MVRVSNVEVELGLKSHQKPYMGGSINGDTAIAGGFIRENPI